MTDTNNTVTAVDATTPLTADQCAHECHQKIEKKSWWSAFVDRLLCRTKAKKECIECHHEEPAAVAAAAAEAESAPTEPPALGPGPLTAVEAVEVQNPAESAALNTGDVEGTPIITGSTQLQV